MQSSKKCIMDIPGILLNQDFLASVTDPEERTTSYETDEMGRVTAIHRPDLTSIDFEYDNNGNMTVLENPSSVEHGFDYNGNDAKAGYQTPQSGSYRYTYNKDRRDELPGSKGDGGARGTPIKI